MPTAKRKPRQKSPAAKAPVNTAQQGRASVTEAAAFLGVSKGTVYRLCHAETIPHIWVGCQLKIEWDVLHKVDKGEISIRVPTPKTRKAAAAV